MILSGSAWTERGRLGRNHDDFSHNQSWIHLSSRSLSGTTPGLQLDLTPPRGAEFISRQVTAASRFYLNLRPRSARDLAVVCGGWEACAGNYAVDRRTFPYWSIEFVAEGKGALDLAGCRHRLSPGTLFAYGPGVPHRLRTSPHARLVKYFVDFVGRPGYGLLQSCGLLRGRVVRVEAIGALRADFDALIGLGLRQDSLTERTCKLQLELLLHGIARSRRPASEGERRGRAAFERVRGLMDARFLELSSVSELAAASHLDSSHLSRLLRRFNCDPPLRYLQRRKMVWAAERLRTTEVLVRQVADELGLDPFQFSRTFKRVHGVSPAHFVRRRF
jgi:AraC-like DNA-binding protein